MPDIIFMDMRMPVMDGPQTLQHIYDQYGRDATQIVAVTASVFEHQRKSYLDLGFNGFIDKPLRVEQVYESLAHHLGITYTFVEEEIETQTVMDWSTISLPAEVYQNLLAAVEEHSITGLRQHIAELEALGEATLPLATHLSELTQNIDMDGIKRVLEEIRTLS
jgi:CheY-like chemotaxis protein